MGQCESDAIGALPVSIQWHRTMGLGLEPMLSDTALDGLFEWTLVTCVRAPQLIPPIKKYQFMLLLLFLLIGE